MNQSEKEREEGESVTSGVYRDEPIPVASLRTWATPPEYREMRKMAEGYGTFGQSAAMIFYRQGKFMADFEDDFDFREEFTRYFPTYQTMTLVQLRGYFSWRTKVRRGLIEETSLSFVFVYIYELLNQIGVKSPGEGFHTLKNFWTAYREFDPKIDRYVELWLKDYIVYNNLDKSLLEGLPGADSDRAMLILLNYGAHGADEVFSALDSLSTYKLENSRFYQQYSDEVRSIVSGVFAGLAEYYSRKRKSTIFEKFFGRIHAAYYHMFRSAVFHDRVKHQEFVYEINDIYRYRCRNGNWSCERFWCYKKNIQQIGILLKTVDFLLRREFGFKSALKVDKISGVYQNIIGREIEKYRERQRNDAQARIEIDVSRLQGIRKTSLETRDRLIVEELEEIPVPETAETAEQKNSAGLSDTEYRFLQCLLYGRPYDQLVKSAGLMLSVLVDSINESLFDRFGDTVIFFDGERPELLEDYTDELKGIIGE